MTGIINAQLACQVALPKLKRPSPSFLPQPLYFAYNQQNSIRAKPMSRPGPTPATNNSPIESSALTPNKIMGIDGGMMTPSSAEVACKAVAQGLG